MPKIREVKGCKSSGLICLNSKVLSVLGCVVGDSVNIIELDGMIKVVKSDKDL